MPSSTVGGVISGYCATGNVKSAIAPASVSRWTARRRDRPVDEKAREKLKAPQV